MQISNLFKEAIKNTFYDKKVEIWTSGTIVDDEGAVVENGKETLVETLVCNFQFKTREKIQQEYGNEIEANAIVTCEVTKAKIGDIAFYNNEEYYIKSKIVSDSHTTLLVYGGGVNE